MTLLERLEEQRNEILEKLGKVDKRIVRNGGRSLFQLKEDEPDDYEVKAIENFESKESTLL